MANDEPFGAHDSQHDDIQLDANNDLSQQLLPTLSDKSPIQLSPDAQTPIGNLQNDGRNVYDIIPNNIPPNAHIFDDIPIPPARDNELESDVEDRPHTKLSHSYHSNETMY
jgi:hypothetical protein